MFTQPCFIRKNTPELREKLRKIGYRSMNRSDKEDEGECLLVCEGDEDLIDSYPFYAPRDNKCCNYYDQSQVIDCGVNEDLFMSLAALRDDSDYRQMFICTKDYGVDYELYQPMHKRGDIVHMLFCHHIYDAKGPNSKYWHKLTTEELIRHFKE